MDAEARWPIWQRLVLTTSASLTLFVSFKLFSLFLVPAHLVLGLFLCVHPLGVLIGARWFREPEARPHALRAFFLAACLTVLGLTLLRLATPVLEPPWLTRGFPLATLMRVVMAAGAVLTPFSLASGLLEYLVLSSDRKETGRYALSYSILLGGACLGIVLGYALLPRIGALGLIGVLLVLAAAGAFQKLRLVVTAPLVLCTVLASGSGVDARFVLAISPGGPHSARALVEGGATLALAAWDPHAYTQIVETPELTSGAYDNLVYWTVSPGETIPRGPDGLVYAAFPPNARVAIVGVGGGAQVKDALRLRNDIEIDAYEINRSVVDHFAKHPESNGNAFATPRVHALAEEGRAGVASREYDAIYLPEAGTILGYYRALALDLNFIHTEDAYRSYLSRLRPGGVLAAAFAEYSDPERQLTRQLLSSLARLGLEARGFDDGHYRVVIATRPRDSAVLGRIEARAIRANIELFRADATALPSDDFGASQVLLYNTRPELSRAFGLALAIGIALALALSILLSRRAGGRSFFVGNAIAAGLGAAFVMLENTAILLLARELFSLADAVIVGSAAFLCAAVAGARLSGWLRANPRAAIAFVCIAASLLALCVTSGSPLVGFAGALLVAFVAGTLLPTLLEARADQMPALFACDSVGALLGVVLAFFVPLLHGIRSLGFSAAAAYLVLGCAVVLSSRNARA